MSLFDLSSLGLDALTDLLQQTSSPAGEFDGGVGSLSEDEQAKAQELEQRLDDEEARATQAEESPSRAIRLELRRRTAELLRELPAVDAARVADVEALWQELQAFGDSFGNGGDADAPLPTVFRDALRFLSGLQAPTRVAPAPESYDLPEPTDDWEVQAFLETYLGDHFEAQSPDFATRLGAKPSTPAAQLQPQLTAQELARFNPLPADAKQLVLCAPAPLRTALLKLDTSALQALARLPVANAARFVELSPTLRQALLASPADVHDLLLGAPPALTAKLLALGPRALASLDGVTGAQLPQFVELKPEQRNELGRIPPQARAAYLTAKPEVQRALQKLDGQQLKLLESIEPDQVEAFASLSSRDRSVLSRLPASQRARFVAAEPALRERLASTGKFQRESRLATMPAPRTALGRELTSATAAGRRRLSVQAAQQRRADAAPRLGLDLLAFFGLDGSAERSRLLERATSLSNNFLQAQLDEATARHLAQVALLEDDDVSEALLADVRTVLEQPHPALGSSVSRERLLERFNQMKATLPGFAQSILQPGLPKQELVHALAQAVHASAEFEVRRPRRRVRRPSQASRSGFTARIIAA